MNKIKLYIHELSFMQVNMLIANGYELEIISVVPIPKNKVNHYDDVPTVETNLLYVVQVYEKVNGMLFPQPKWFTYEEIVRDTKLMIEAYES